MTVHHACNSVSSRRQPLLGPYSTEPAHMAVGDVCEMCAHDTSRHPPKLHDAVHPRPTNTSPDQEPPSLETVHA